MSDTDSNLDDNFLRHVAVARSQYDSLTREWAGEILRLREALAASEQACTTLQQEIEKLTHESRSPGLFPVPMSISSEVDGEGA